MRLSAAAIAVGATLGTAILAPAGVAAPATAAKASAGVSAFTLTQVNQEQRQVRPGGKVGLCQAIPFTELAPHVRWSGFGRTGLRAVVELSAPGHRDRRVRRVLRSSRRSGVKRVTFTPESLDDAAFPEGRYVVRVLIGGRVVRSAQISFVAPTQRSC